MKNPARRISHVWLLLVFSRFLLSTLSGQLADKARLDWEVYQNTNIQPLRTIAEKQDTTAPAILFEYCNLRRHPDCHEVAELFLAQAGAEEFLRQKFQTLSNLKEDAEKRLELFDRLRNLRRRWVVDLLGSILETKLLPTTNLTPEQVLALSAGGDAGGGLDDTPNYLLAARTMGYLRPVHFPFRFDPDNYLEAHITEICAWWEANKQHPDAFFFDGSIDYSKKPVWEDRPGFKRTRDMAAWPLPPYPKQQNVTTGTSSELKPSAKTAPRETVTSFWPAFLIGTCMLLSVFFVLIKRGQN